MIRPKKGVRIPLLFTTFCCDRSNLRKMVAINCHTNGIITLPIEKQIQQGFFLPVLNLAAHLLQEICSLWLVMTDWSGTLAKWDHPNNNSTGLNHPFERHASQVVSFPQVWTCLKSPPQPLFWSESKILSRFALQKQTPFEYDQSTYL